MRVHGEIKIKRRADLEKKGDYTQYLEPLRQDFRCICGYCGKSEKVTKNAFEIDHFAPQTLAKEWETVYENLVYSCFTCNRKKGGKWPTRDKLKPNDGKVGLVDPANEEYDAHLFRNENGTIDGLTPVGKYMCDNIFKFKMRPIRELWLCSEIISRQEILQARIELMTPEESREYIELDAKLKELQQLLFSKKE